MEKNTIRSLKWDFPGGPVVKNPPCNAKDIGSIPDQGTQIPTHVLQLLRLQATLGVSALQQKDLTRHN